MLPKARTVGDDYSDEEESNSDDDDEDMDSNEEESDEEDDDSADDLKIGTVKSKNSRHMKTIMKRKMKQN